LQLSKGDILIQKTPRVKSIDSEEEEKTQIIKQNKGSGKLKAP
jgi:phage FluMu protein Com